MKRIKKIHFKKNHEHSILIPNKFNRKKIKKRNYLKLGKYKSKKIDNKDLRFFLLYKLLIIFIFIYLLFLIIKYKENTAINSIYSKTKVCVCTLGKNENRYIREWVHHYEKYGIDKIYLYDNNSPDGERFEEVIQDYIDKGFVEIFNWRGKLKSIMYIMNDCYQKNYDKYDWIVFYEIDEFINLKNYTNIKPFLNQQIFNNCQLIYLNLLLHTDNNQLYYENKPLIERFPEIVPLSRHYFEIKSILRGHIPNITIKCIHRINSHLINCNGFGHRNKNNQIFSTEPDTNLYYIDHFYCKSIEEFISKINRGDPLFNTNKYKMERIEKFYKQSGFTLQKIEMIENGTGLDLSKYKKIMNYL